MFAFVCVCVCVCVCVVCVCVCVCAHAWAHTWVNAGIKVKSIVSYNHLGNNDGKNLSQPDMFRSKEISKSNVVDDMVPHISHMYYVFFATIVFRSQETPRGVKKKKS